MGQLAIDEALRDDADHLAAGRQGRVRDDAHEPDAAAAVHDADAALGQTLADGPCERRVRRVVAGELAPQKTQIGGRAITASEPERRRGFGVIRRAARARCEIACFSAARPQPERAAAGRLRGGLEDRVVAEPAACPAGAAAIRPRQVPRA